MESKKITIIIVSVILIATAAILGIKIAGKNARVSAPKTETLKPAANAVKNGADSSSVKNVTPADPDAKALESDLNSVSDDDFSDSSLSDSAVGL